MKKVFIIGGTGSWGQELTRQILHKYKSVQEIIIFSRGEHNQVEMARKFNNKKLKFIIGDIRDKNNLKIATTGIDYLFHLAALKHVPVCEMNPEEAIKTNIMGTINAVEVANENNIGSFILISTDKAVDPINTYGVSKSMAEKIVVTANQKTKSTKFVCIRGGNVLGTTGSVVPLFKKQIQKVNELTITEKEMTRYLMRLEEAISLIFKAVSDSYGGEIFVMKMPSVKIINLAKILIQELGNSKTKIKNIGIRPGEKLHEVLVSKYEANRTFEHGKYYVVLPNMNINNIYEKWNIKSFLQKEYNSKDNYILKDDELVSILEKDGWLNDTTWRELENYSKKELIEYFKRENWEL